MARIRPAITVPGLNGGAPSAYIGSGTRVNATATTASTAEAAVPANTGLIVVRVAAPGVSIRFGATGMDAAANAATSIMLPAAGEYLIELAATDTHFRCIRTLAADVGIQLEALTPS